MFLQHSPTKRSTDKDLNEFAVRKRARFNYTKRKLCNEVNRYINKARVVKYREIVKIQSKYGI